MLSHGSSLESSPRNPKAYSENVLSVAHRKIRQKRRKAEILGMEKDKMNRKVKLA